MLKFTLVLLFACDAACGGQPPQVVLDTYNTFAECVAHGKVWLQPNANPQHALKEFSCRPIVAPKP